MSPDRPDDTDAYLKRVKAMTEPVRQPDQRPLHEYIDLDVYGVVTREAYEKLEAELAAREQRITEAHERETGLERQLRAAEQQLTNLRGIAIEAISACPQEIARPLAERYWKLAAAGDQQEQQTP